MRNFRRAAFALTIGSVFAAPAAQAALTLTLSDGTNNVSVADGGAGDWDLESGSIYYSGSVGGFTGDFKITTESTAPTGSGNILTLSKIDIKSGSGSLSIKATEDAYDTPFTPVTAILGSTLQQGTKVSFQGGFNGNADLGFALEDATLTDQKTGSASKTISLGGTTYSAFISAVVTADGNQTQFQSTLSVVPLPASALLLLSGLGGIGFAARRRRGAAA